eukprot:gb/GEZJ01004286.1/.p1 GENE.gb/GEZJ01004286.1/~~gb/GEZJ01004286.1/.p1  ORF type:complete len:223 (-),score=29.13 gb/GEZJ01004286.1/:157-825(-)
MNFLTLSLFGALLVCAVNAVSLPTTLREQIEEGKRLVGSKGCNANVCFALDGSGSMTPSDFQLQKEFVQDVVSIIATDNDVEFAAVQYGLDNSPISPLGKGDANFLTRIDQAEFLNALTTFMGAGIVYCDFELSARENELAKIVVIGDGRDNFGGDPVRRARNFRQFFFPNGVLSAVGVGFEDTTRLTEIANAGGGSVFNVDNYRELSRLILTLVREVCNIN